MAVPETSPSRHGEINAWRTNKLHSLPTAPGWNFRDIPSDTFRIASVVPIRESRTKPTDQPAPRKQFSREQLFWHAAVGKMHRGSFFRVFEMKVSNESIVICCNRDFLSLCYTLRIALNAANLLSGKPHVFGATGKLCAMHVRTSLIHIDIKYS